MKNYYSLNESNCVKDAFAIFNKAFGSVLCVENKKKKLIGLLTEGDLRRALLKGSSLKEKLKKIVNKSFTFVYEN